MLMEKKDTLWPPDSCSQGEKTFCSMISPKWVCLNERGWEGQRVFSRCFMIMMLWWWGFVIAVNKSWPKEHDLACFAMSWVEILLLSFPSPHLNSTSFLFFQNIFGDLLHSRFFVALLPHSNCISYTAGSLVFPIICPLMIRVLETNTAFFFSTLNWLLSIGGHFPELGGSSSSIPLLLPVCPPASWLRGSPQSKGFDG